MKRIYYARSFEDMGEGLDKWLESFPFPSTILKREKKLAVIESSSMLGINARKYPRFYFEAVGPRSVLFSSHAMTPLADYLSEEALSFFTGEFAYLSEVILKSASFGNYGFVPLLASEFKGVSEELLETAYEYLRSGQMANVASSILYIHRNTFAYRLKKFEEVTSLDLRDYHDALTLELFFQFTHRPLHRYN